MKLPYLWTQSSTLETISTPYPKEQRMEFRFVQQKEDSDESALQAKCSELITDNNIVEQSFQTEITSQTKLIIVGECPYL